MTNPTLRVVARIVALPEKVEALKAVLEGFGFQKGEVGQIRFTFIQLAMAH